MSQINPKKIFYNIAHSVQPPYIADRSLKKNIVVAIFLEGINPL